MQKQYVQCIDNKGNEGTLISGSVYPASSRDDEFISIVDETGNENNYCAGAFTPFNRTSFTDNENEYIKEMLENKLHELKEDLSLMEKRQARFKKKDSSYTPTEMDRLVKLSILSDIVSVNSMLAVLDLSQQKRNRIIVTCEGGIVRCIYSDNSDLQVVEVLDFDELGDTDKDIVKDFVTRYDALKPLIDSMTDIFN